MQSSASLDKTAVTDTLAKRGNAIERYRRVNAADFNRPSAAVFH